VFVAHAMKKSSFQARRAALVVTVLIIACVVGTPIVRHRLANAMIVSLWRTGNASVTQVKSALQNGADVNAKDMIGLTPLMLASERGDFACVKFLVANGASINAKTDNFGDTALLDASMGGSVDCVRFIISKGANLNVKASGYTPLMQAVMKEHPDCVRALIAAHADLNAKDNHGETALAMASECGCGTDSHNGDRDITAALKAAGAKQ
jgi:ankyrin repeat protein